MTFLHGTLMAAGSLFVAIPIVLHLIMRQRPKQALFPALRFITATLVANQRKLRLKQWLLLALRCLAVALAAFSLARPVLPPQWGGSGWLPTDQEAPVAALFLFDTSPRMLYQQANQTRLEQAQVAARQVLAKLPAGSSVAIMTSEDRGAVFSSEFQATEAAIQALTCSFAEAPLPDALRIARALLKEQSQTRHELYVFSDLTLRAWNGTGNPPGLTSADLPRGAAADVPSHATMTTYVIDVGVPQPRNVRLSEPRLPPRGLTPGTPVQLGIDVLQEGPPEAGPLVVEFYVESPTMERPVVVDGKPQLLAAELRHRLEIDSAVGSSLPASAVLQGLEEGVHHGRIRVISSDGLRVDDERYFSLRVEPPRRILLAAGPGAVPRFVAEALAPYPLRESGRARFEIEQIALAELIDYDLSAFAAIVLLDPGPLDDGTWSRLRDAVQQGGAVMIALGRNVDSVNKFDVAAAREMLPGRLVRQWRSGERPLSLEVSAANHPMLQAFTKAATAVPWRDFPIYRHWVFADLQPNAIVVASWSNRAPAILESRVGEGTVVTITTPLSDPLNRRDRPAWNELPTGPDPWPFVVLVNEIVRSVSDQSSKSLNFVVGDRVSLEQPLLASSQRLAMFTPLGTWRSIVQNDNSVALGRLETPGIYRVFPSERGAAMTGLSVNLPSEATQLARAEKTLLDQCLGAEQYRRIDDPSLVDRAVSDARVGREILPIGLLVLAVILIGEHLLANRLLPAPAPAVS